MDRDIMQQSNQKMYAAQAQSLKAKRAMEERQMLEMRIREMKSLGVERLMNKHPAALTGLEKEWLERYKALKEKADALYCLATTGSWPAGYVPTEDEFDATKRAW
ncbi:MAG: hypothetical protein HDT14_13060 [Oscillibacter sp.]|nr:hypothetical protein [Oscillibacter sp.]